VGATGVAMDEFLSNPSRCHPCVDEGENGKHVTGASTG
jgi:hypothetical protein